MHCFHALAIVVFLAISKPLAAFELFEKLFTFHQPPGQLLFCSCMSVAGITWMTHLLCARIREAHKALSDPDLRPYLEQDEAFLAQRYVDGSRMAQLAALRQYVRKHINCGHPNRTIHPEEHLLSFKVVAIFTLLYAILPVAYLLNLAHWPEHTEL